MDSPTKFLCAAVSTVIICAIPISGRAEAPRVVATIPPIHALVSAVMRGIGQPHLLIDKRVSPHEFTLRPSQARAVARADLVVWIGPELEAPLRRSLEARSTAGAELRIFDIRGLERLEARPGGAWLDNAHDEHDSDSHSDDVYDPHLWLSLKNAKMIGQAVSAALAKIDPPNAEKYVKNTAELHQRLSELETAIKATLDFHSERRFVLLHDSLQYFEHAFGLTSVGAATTASAQGPGARRLLTLKNLVDGSGVRCIVADPYVSGALTRTLAEGSGAKTAEIDPLGYSHPPGIGQYDAMMLDIAKKLAACLAP